MGGKRNDRNNKKKNKLLNFEISPLHTWMRENEHTTRFLLETLMVFRHMCALIYSHLKWDKNCKNWNEESKHTSEPLSHSLLHIFCIRLNQLNSLSSDTVSCYFAFRFLCVAAFICLFIKLYYTDMINMCV